MVAFDWKFINVKKQWKGHETNLNRNQSSRDLSKPSDRFKETSSENS